MRGTSTRGGRASGCLVFDVTAAFIELPADKIDLLRTQILRLPFPNDLRDLFMTSNAEGTDNTFGDPPARQSQNGFRVNPQSGAVVDELA
jgi:hypothetical protein